MAADHPSPSNGPTNSTTSGSSNGSAGPATREEIEADIAQTREQLGQTVDALTQRLDVKSRTKAKVAETRERTTEQVKANPAIAIGAGAAVLLLVGLVVWRRQR